MTPEDRTPTGLVSLGLFAGPAASRAPEQTSWSLESLLAVGHQVAHRLDQEGLALAIEVYD